MNSTPDQTNEQTTVRSFIAIEINDTIRGRLSDIQNTLKKVNGHVSWVQPQNVHCTLVFLGDIFQPAVDSVANALAKTAAGCKPFEIEISSLGFFGSARSPRIIWAGMTGQTDVLINLQGKITAAVLQAGLKPDEKPFKPHLTIGRVRSNRNAPALVEAIKANETKTFGKNSVGRVVLMKSQLTASGPIYSILLAKSLDG